MARDVLLAAVSEVDRLLAAGASAAGEGLRKHGRTIRELAGKVPALVPLANAIDRLLQAPPEQAGPPFLDLLALTRLVRLSFAGSGVTGDLEPLPESSSWRTDASTRDLHLLEGALLGKRTARQEIISSGLETAAKQDLRLVPTLIDAVNRRGPAILKLLAEKALPEIGKAVAAASPEEVERFAQGWCDADWHPRRAILAVLRSAKIDDHVDLLLALVKKGGKEAEVARRTLIASVNPAVTAHLLPRLKNEVTPIFCLPSGQRNDSQAGWISTLLDILGQRADSLPVADVRLLLYYLNDDTSLVRAAAWKALNSACVVPEKFRSALAEAGPDVLLAVLDGGGPLASQAREQAIRSDHPEMTACLLRRLEMERRSPWMQADQSSHLSVELLLEILSARPDCGSGSES